jgi:hypothetical protein
MEILTTHLLYLNASTPSAGNLVARDVDSTLAVYALESPMHNWAIY